MSQFRTRLDRSLGPIARRGGAALLAVLILAGSLPAEAFAAAPAPEAGPTRTIVVDDDFGLDLAPALTVAERRTHGFRSVEAAAAARHLQPAVLDALDRDGHADTIVVFDGSDVRRSAEMAAGPRTSETGRERAARITDGLTAGYRTVKGRALRSIPGVTVVDELDAVGLAVVRFTSRAGLLRVLNDGFVLGIQMPRTFTPLLAESLGVIRQPETAQAGYRGAGTTVAILDTGVNYASGYFGTCSQPGAAGCRIIEAYDFGTDDGVLDNDGHGTNVAGIAAGVAPGARLLAYDVFDQYWTGTAWKNSANETVVVKAINRVVALAATYGIASMNLSLGSEGDTARWTTNCTTNGGYVNGYVQAFADARAVGVLPVVAAGNDATMSNGSFGAGVSFPACTPGAVSVGATYDANVGALVDWWRDCNDYSSAKDQIVCFSQSGPNLTVLAPGACITAAGIGVNYCYGGTSQAAPHVAGAAAVLRAARPGASLDQLVSAIATTGPAIPDPRPGAGQKRRLDLAAAMTALLGSGTGTDTTKPVFSSTSPVQAVSAGWSLATTGGTPVTAGWKATDASGIERYNIQLAVNGTWYDYTAYLASATSESLTITGLVPGSSYQFAVIARDAAGNWSDWKLGPVFTVGTTQENGTGLAYYGGGWTRSAWSSALGGYLTYGATAKAYARYTFTGRNVAWVATSSANRGAARVYLDGTLVATVDLYSATTIARRVQFSAVVDPSRSHTLDIQVVGTSGRPTIDIDAIVVLR